MIGVDADDTLWHSETVFERAQERFRGLLARYHSAPAIDRVLFDTEARNLPLYGYGVKGFMLSAIEAAITATGGAIGADEIQAILDTGREMLAHPIELLPGVEEVLPALARDYRVLLITKGDLHHQERKVADSGLEAHFDAVEIVSEKDRAAYARVLQRHGVAPDAFAMVGNSLKSDVLPVLALGGAGVYIPYAITWQHERVDAAPIDAPRYRRLDSLRELPPILPSL